MFLIFDVETTGFIKGDSPDYTNLDNFPRIVQLAYQLHGKDGKMIHQYVQIVKPDGFEIPYQAAKVHKITTERALKEGVDLSIVMNTFLQAIQQTQIIVGHNIKNFDIPVVKAELIRLGMDISLLDKMIIDTCTDKEIINYCQLPGGKGGGYKTPSLSELYKKLFDKEFELAHNAAFDVQANAVTFFELIKKGVIQIPDISVDASQINYEAPDLSALYETEKTLHKKDKHKKIIHKDEKQELNTTPLSFAYLHNHTIYSIGNSTTDVKQLVKKAAEYQASALAITDLGYMSGIIEFSNAIKNINKEISKKNKENESIHPQIKPIIGCEFYLCEDIRKDNSKYQNFHIPILAKNEKGYSNLCKLSSLSFIEGFYYVPRIDKKNLLKNKEGLIVLSGWIYGEIPQVLMKEGEQKAEEVILWYKENFNEDFYLEINNHFLEDEKYINDFLIKMSEKHNIKIIAAQNNFYLNQEDADICDTLICIRQGEEKSKPIGKGSGKRYGLPNNEFYFKSSEEIQKIFSFYPQAITNAIELAEKIEVFDVEKNIALPKFDIPKEFSEQYPNTTELELQNKYLRHLAYQGAEKKYGTLTEEIKARIEFELDTIEKMGFPGYFLIISEILSVGRQRGIRIGPGRGSAAGSIVAYCLNITNVNPIQYGLLFERFLNPERISMPDIDIDIADDRRDELIEYIIQKYGKDKVANIITFASLGGKSAIRDAARTLGVPPQEVNMIAKAYEPLETYSLKELLEPEKINFENYVTENQDIKSLKEQFNRDYDNFIRSHSKSKEILKYAAGLDGCFRHTGKHACGLIIAPENLDEITPLAKDTKSGQIITQYDVNVAEKAGLLKMDFLGLTTLSIITETIRFVQENKNIEIDIDNIPLNDEKTLDIFRNGYTDEVFQFESPGMKKYLKQLKPDSINDLVAMNALYRPGPMKYIDSYIRRKHGVEKINYPFPEMEEILKETYGITVYQEQVMLLSQKLAGFTKGQADELRKAMGKKKLDVLQKMEDQFFQGCKKNGFNLDVVKKIWEDWKDFASYAFNKSHSVCYAILAYQTAYLKAHYPAEFMCAVLNTKKDIKGISKVLAECNRMNIKILPPDINESDKQFSVMKDGSIRFGLSSIKNVGHNFAEELIKDRKEHGEYTNIFQLAERLPSNVLNKKNIENLAMAGAFDTFQNIHRAMFFEKAADGLTLTEKLSKFSEDQQKKQTKGASLFDSSDDNTSLINKYPDILPVKEWNFTTRLLKEKEVLGFFISGKPTDEYSIVLKLIPHINISELEENIEVYKNQDVYIIGWTDSIEEFVSKKGSAFYNIILEDHTGSIKLSYIDDKIAAQYKLKEKMNQLNCFLVKGKVENRNYSDPTQERWEYKVTKCIDIKDFLSQDAELKVLINVKNIQLEMIKNMERMFQPNGGIPIKTSLIITDDERKNHIVTSNLLKISFNEKNLKLLEQYHLEYKLVMND